MIRDAVIKHASEPILNAYCGPRTRPFGARSWQPSMPDQAPPASVVDQAGCRPQKRWTSRAATFAPATRCRGNRGEQPGIWPNTRSFLKTRNGASCTTDPSQIDMPTSKPHSNLTFLLLRPLSGKGHEVHISVPSAEAGVGNAMGNKDHGPDI